MRKPLAFLIAVLISESVKNSKGLSLLIDLIKICEKMYSILAPPITESLELSVLPSISSTKYFTYLFTRDKIRIP